MKLPRGIVFLIGLLILVSGCVRQETPRLEGIPEDAPPLKLHIPKIRIGPRVNVSSEPDEESPLLLPALQVERDTFYAALPGSASIGLLHPAA